MLLSEISCFGLLRPDSNTSWNLFGCRSVDGRFRSVEFISCINGTDYLLHRNGWRRISIAWGHFLGLAHAIIIQAGSPVHSWCTKHPVRLARCVYDKGKHVCRGRLPRWDHSRFVHLVALDEVTSEFPAHLVYKNCQSTPTPRRVFLDLSEVLSFILLLLTCVAFQLKWAFRWTFH